MLAALALAAAVAATPQQFDLICKGTVTTQTYAREGAATVVPWQASFAIDLARSVYSQNGGAVRDFLTISDTRLIIEDPSQGEQFNKTFIDRVTGDYYDGFVGDKKSITVSARCVRSQFTGLPSAKF